MNHQSAQEVRSNALHSHARSVVECFIGFLKGRWLALDVPGGRLLYQPETVCKIIRACAVVHNLALLDSSKAIRSVH